MATPIANLFDAFDDGTIDTTKWTVGGVWSAASGAACATMPSAGSSLTSVKSYSFNQSSIFIETVSYLNGAGAASGASLFRLFNSADSNDYVQFVINPPTNQILLQYVENAVIITATTLTYDPVTMRWLRLRENATTVYFETSPDGTTWTTRLTSASQTWVTSVKALIFAAQSGGAATTKCFDNVNIAPASSRAVAVGSEFEITEDGKLRLERCDQPDSTWTYPCSESAYNALRRSEDPCGLWVQPPPKQYVDVEVASVSTSEDSRKIITLELTNPDPCRYMSFYLPLTAAMRFTLEAKDDGTGQDVTSWALGVQVTGVDNPDDGFTTIIAGDFHIPGTHLWRGVADYFWTAAPGATTTVEVELKVFKGGGAPGVIAGYQARLGVLGWSEVGL